MASSSSKRPSRTTRTGGPYVYVQDAFGDLAGFLIAWGYWVSYVISIPAVAIAFAGYLPVFALGLENNPIGQALSALALVWLLTFISIRGLREASFVQIAMTLLKIAPLLAISGLGLVAGNAANLPAFNPTSAALLPALAATSLLTMWAFTGLEAGAAPAANVKNAERTIPRAIIIGTLSVTLIYLSSTMAVMLLVPAETLVNSSSPFADAARGFGAWGPLLVGAGALMATAGSLNGIIFVAGQMPMAVALDKLAPAFLARTNKGGAPQLSLLLASVLGSLLLVANYSRGAIGAFTFLLMMSTVTVLLPYLFSAAAELRCRMSVKVHASYGACPRVPPNDRSPAPTGPALSPPEAEHSQVPEASDRAPLPERAPPLCRVLDDDRAFLRGEILDPVPLHRVAKEGGHNEHSSSAVDRPFKTLPIRSQGERIDIIELNGDPRPDRSGSHIETAIRRKGR